MPGYPSERLRICNNPKCLSEFISTSRKLFYCHECNKERIRKKRKQRYESNKEDILEKSRAYYREHREEIIRRGCQYAIEHREAHRESSRKSKARKRARLRENSTITTVEKMKNTKNVTDVLGLGENESERRQIIEKMKKLDSDGGHHYCERMRVKATTLPCGTRHECYMGKKCEHAPDLKPQQRKRMIDLIWK